MIRSAELEMNAGHLIGWTVERAVVLRHARQDNGRCRLVVCQTFREEAVEAVVAAKEQFAGGTSIRGAGSVNSLALQAVQAR